MSIRIEVLTTEEAIEREFLESLERRHLEEKFFYWFPLSVSAWINLCNSKEYKNYSRSYQLTKRISDDVAARIESRRVTWIGLGCGDGAKEILLLKSLQHRNVEVSFRAVDFSLSLLERACRAAQEEGISAIGYKADVTRHLEEVSLNTGSTTKVYSLLGNTLGAFQKKDTFLKQIAKQMKPGDYFLVDGELYNADVTFAGYENPSNRTFAIAPLYSAGLQEDDGRLIFALEADPKREGFYRVRKHFQFERDRTLYLSGARLDYKKGDIIQMSYSYKYDYDAFMSLLSKQTRWKLAAPYLSDDKNYLATLWRAYDTVL